MSEKKPPISMSMRWRVPEARAARFKSDLALQGLTVQQVGEAFTEAYEAMPTSLRSELARQIITDDAAGAGAWLAKMIKRGIEAEQEAAQ